MFLFVVKALFTEFCNCACAKKIVMLIRIRHTCVALIHKKTVLSLETSSEINFEFIKGALAWYGKLTWESAHAWILKKIMLFNCLGYNFKI